MELVVSEDLDLGLTGHAIPVMEGGPSMRLAKSLGDSFSIFTVSYIWERKGHHGILRG